MRNSFILNAVAVILLVFVTAMLLLWPRDSGGGYEGTMYRPQSGTFQDPTGDSDTQPTPDPSEDDQTEPEAMEPTEDTDTTAPTRRPETEERPDITEPTVNTEPTEPSGTEAAPETTEPSEPVEEETTQPPATEPAVGDDGYYNEVIRP